MIYTIYTVPRTTVYKIYDVAAHIRVISMKEMSDRMSQIPKQWAASNSERAARAILQYKVQRSTRNVCIVFTAVYVQSNPRCQRCHWNEKVRMVVMIITIMIVGSDQRLPVVIQIHSSPAHTKPPSLRERREPFNIYKDKDSNYYV